MKKEMELELYTRPTCSDCQEAKKYLAEKDISYRDIDVSKDPSVEEDLKKISGTRIVPSFAFYKKGFFGKKKLLKNFIGFEINKEEIKGLLNAK